MIGLPTLYDAVPDNATWPFEWTVDVFVLGVGLTTLTIDALDGDILSSETDSWVPYEHRFMAAPEQHGFAKVGEVYATTDGYDWTAIAVFRRISDGVFFVHADSGCSCNSWGDGLNGESDLSRFDADQFARDIRQRFGNPDSYRFDANAWEKARDLFFEVLAAQKEAAK